MKKSTREIKKMKTEVMNGGRYGENVEEIKTRTMLLIYVFDKSISMDGVKIGQVNYAMKDIPDIVENISDSAPNANIAVCAATFGSNVEWLTLSPQSPSAFKETWKDVKVGGMTALGAMLTSIDEKLSRSAFIGENPMGYYAPGIIFLSDGVPTDDWKGPLEKLKRNKWYNAAIKIAFAIGDDADKGVLAEVCGSPEAVISIDDPEKIRDYINFVTVHVSRTGTRGTEAQDKTAQEEVIEKIKKAEEDDDTPIVVNAPEVNDEQF